MRTSRLKASLSFSNKQQLHKDRQWNQRKDKPWDERVLTAPASEMLNLQRSKRGKATSQHNESELHLQHRFFVSLLDRAGESVFIYTQDGRSFVNYPMRSPYTDVPPLRMMHLQRRNFKIKGHNNALWK